MDSNTTYLFDVQTIEDKLITEVLDDVYQALEEKGYNPMNQIVGYLMSGDPGYISSYKDAREKISKLDRNKIIETLLRKGFKKWDI